MRNAGDENWICPVDWTEEDRRMTRLVFYRGTLHCAHRGSNQMVRIAADSRYKIWVNGTLAAFGPAKGDAETQYFDELDLSPFLKEGKNTLAVAVLHCPETAADGGNHSLFRCGLPVLLISAGENWLSRVERSVLFPAEEQRFAPLQIHEVSAEGHLTAWQRPEYEDGTWDAVRTAGEWELPAVLFPENLKPRPIPLMEQREGKLSLPEHVVPAWTERTWTLDAVEETCAFVRLPFSGGAGAEVRVLYSECYVTSRGKADRTDALHGHLEGYEDICSVSGAEGESLEPFWWRTFRYIRVTVRTGASPLKLGDLSMMKTGYPLQVGSMVTVSDETLSPVWDISLRTLRRCMHDTYMDCPFYEQLQYIMDTRSQALYTYAVSADDRLARKALEEFHHAQRPDGLLNCSYPNVNENVIPTFSVYYILMLHDHMMYFGDRVLVARHLNTVYRVLTFFRRHLTAEGLVDKIGGVNGKAPFWSFVDWAEAWMPTEGMPDAGLDGPITMESLLYLYGLQAAADLEDYAGGSRSAAYREEAAVLQAAIRACCTDGEGFLVDGPGKIQRSQHCQVFGILTGTLDSETGRRAMMATLHDRKITQCSIAMCFYLFRALERVGLYRYTDRYWDIWRHMVSRHCTTCVEAEGYSRSECHAWGALALYELPSAVLGVRPAAPGYAKIAVQPVPGYLTYASGTVRTPRGDLQVSWELEKGEMHLRVDCEEALKSDIIIKSE